MSALFAVWDLFAGDLIIIFNIRFFSLKAMRTVSAMPIINNEQLHVRVILSVLP